MVLRLSLPKVSQHCSIFFHSKGTAMEFLSMHPDVVIARRDNDSMELQFFQNDLLYQDGKGLDWYRYNA